MQNFGLRSEVDLPALLLRTIAPVHFVKEYRKIFIKHAHFAYGFPAEQQARAHRLVDLSFLVIAKVGHPVTAESPAFREDSAQAGVLEKHAQSIGETPT